MLALHITVLHVLNTSWYHEIGSELKEFKTSFGNVAYINSSTTFVTDGHQPCFRRHESPPSVSEDQESYFNFPHANTTVIFVGETDPETLRDVVTFCYPWITRFCRASLAGKAGSECCDAYLEDTSKKFWEFRRIFQNPDENTREATATHSFNTSRFACGKCGPFRELSGNIFSVTSENSVIRCRVPSNGWIFRPHEDWSVAFHDVKLERKLPYGNQILKVLSQKMNCSFRFDNKFPSEYYGNGFISTVLRGKVASRTPTWDGALDALLKRETLLAIGSVWMYHERDQYFSDAGVFSQTNIELANHVERVQYDKFLLLDVLSLKNISFFLILILLSSTLICVFDHGSFSAVFVHLFMMPVAPSRKILLQRRSCVLLAFRISNIFLCIHLMLLIMEKRITPQYRSLFFDLPQVRDHIRRHPNSRIWGNQDEIETIQKGLQGDYLASSIRSQQLKEILNKSAFFSYRPSHSKLAIFARQNVDDFIFEETKELAFNTNLRHRKKFLHSVAAVNQLYETVYVQKGCSIRFQVSKILRRLSELGLIHHWRKGSQLRKHSLYPTYSALNSESVRGVRSCISWLITVAFFIFAAELAVDECINMWRTRAAHIADPEVEPEGRPEGRERQTPAASCDSEGPNSLNGSPASSTMRTDGSGA